jgi:hypothetical protein
MLLASLLYRPRFFRKFVAEESMLRISELVVVDVWQKTMTHFTACGAKLNHGE